MASNPTRQPSPLDSFEGIAGESWIHVDRVRLHIAYYRWHEYTRTLHTAIGGVANTFVPKITALLVFATLLLAFSGIPRAHAGTTITVDATGCPTIGGSW